MVGISAKGVRTGRGVSRNRSGLRVKHRLPRWVAGLVSSVLLYAMPTAGQVLRPVEVSDRVFEALERAQAFGVLDTIPVGQRVGLERTIARALGGPENSDWSLRELRELLDRPALRGSLAVSYAWTDATKRFIPSNGLGKVDAVVSPLTQSRGGYRLGDGSNVSIDPGLAGAFGEWQFTLRSHVRWDDGGGGEIAEGRIQEAWAEGPLGPLYVSVGRAPVVWGQSGAGGSIFSGDARALDQVSIANDGTVRLPWILRHLGPTRLSLTVSRLEGARDIPHSFLVGYKVSSKPFPSLEIGGGLQVHSGGDGAPGASFGDRILDHIVGADKRTLRISNKLAAFDVRWRVPSTRGSQAYVSLAVDDFGRDFGRVFGQETAYIAGVVFPRLTQDGRVGLRFEYRETGVRFSQHSIFTSGLSFDRVLLGDALGPDGRGAYVSIDMRPTKEDRIAIVLGREERSNDTWVVDEGFVFRKTVDLPEETRTRAELIWERSWPSRGMGMVMRGGYERVSDFGFVNDQRHGNTVFEIRGVVWTSVLPG